MANKVRFLISDILDDSTVTASSATSGLAANNVRDQLVRKVYRTTGIVNEWIQLQVSGAETAAEVNAVFIGRHNFTVNATLLLQGNTTSTWTSGPALSTALSVATDSQGNVIPKLAHFFSSVENHRFWRLYMEDSTNSSTYLELGRVMAGRYIEPDRNLRDGFRITHVDPSRISRTAGRQGYANTRPGYMEMTYSVFDLDEDDFDELFGIYNTVGMHTAFMLALDPEERPHHNTIYCQFMNPMARQQRFLRQYNLQEITFQEKN